MQKPSANAGKEPNHAILILLAPSFIDGCVNEDDLSLTNSVAFGNFVKRTFFSIAATTKIFA